MRTLRRAIIIAAVLSLPSLSGCFFDRGVEPEDYLTDRYAKWVIEVDYVRGHRPDQAVLDAVLVRMREISHKTGVQAIIDDELPAGRGPWDGAKLRDLQADFQDQKTGDDTVVTYLVFLDGRTVWDDGNARVLGAVPGGSHDMAAIFSQNIRDSCNLSALCLGGDQTRDIYQATSIHEMGHVLGLVNRGIAMQTDREDPEHPGHSSNEDSVMYWAVETNQIMGLLAGGIPKDFDRNDREDLRAAGGR